MWWFFDSTNLSDSESTFVSLINAFVWNLKLLYVFSFKLLVTKKKKSPSKNHHPQQQQNQTRKKRSHERNRTDLIKLVQDFHLSTFWGFLIFIWLLLLIQENSEHPKHTLKPKICRSKYDCTLYQRLDLTTMFSAPSFRSYIFYFHFQAHLKKMKQESLSPKYPRHIKILFH